MRVLSKIVEQLNPFKGAHGAGSDTIRADLVIYVRDHGRVSFEALDCSAPTYSRITDDLENVEKRDGLRAIVGTRDGVARWAETEFFVNQSAARRIANELLTEEWVDTIPDIRGFEFDYWNRTPRLVKALNDDDRVSIDHFE